MKCKEYPKVQVVGDNGCLLRPITEAPLFTQLVSGQGMFHNYLAQYPAGGIQHNASACQLAITTGSPAICTNSPAIRVCDYGCK